MRDLKDPTHWVFNRLADDYHARPAYPVSLIDRLCSLLSKETIADLGAGTGHLSLPLAACGFSVYAIEPAASMREQLTRAAGRQADLRQHPESEDDDKQSLGTVLQRCDGKRTKANRVVSIAGTAEETTLPAKSVDGIVAGEAAQWFQLEKAVVECRRILRPKGIVAAIEWAPSTAAHQAPLQTLLQRYNPKTIGRTNQPAAQWVKQTCRKAPQRESFLAKIDWSIERFIQATRSYSYVGPALGPERLLLFEGELRKLLLGLYQQSNFIEERSVELYWERI